jgi:hypothetical protein
MQGGFMNDLLKPDNPSKRFSVLVVFLLMILQSISMASAHGPKGHSGAEFTAAQAVQKGIALYDKLLVSGKLSEPWETDLANIEIFSRQIAQKRETIVKFSRNKGEPRSVYIFFSKKGEYIGSNFTGN